MGHIAVTPDGGIGRRRATHGTASATLAALVLVALGLAGCSAGGGSTAADEAGAPGVVVEDGTAADADRSIIVEGTMSVVVEDVAAAADDATGIVRSAAGRIDGREEWNRRDGDDTYAVTTMTLRIPATALDAAIEDLRGLGTVESLQTTTRDVTTAVQDVDAHISALESTIARLQSFQDEATSVGDLLAIEKEMAARQAELEGYRARQTDYAEQIEYSTIVLTLQSEPSPPGAAPDSFWSGLIVGWDSFSAFLLGLVVVLGVALPWLLGFGILAAAIVLLVRRMRRRRTPKEPDRPQHPGPAIPWVDEDPTSTVHAGSRPPAP